MRAREFITEKKARIHPDHQSALGPSMVYPDMDMGYDYYRFMTRVAGYPEHIAPHDHEHYRDYPVAAAYTQQELEMLKGSVKGTPWTGKVISDTDPHEPDSNNKVSPVNANSGKRIKRK